MRNIGIVMGAFALLAGPAWADDTMRSTGSDSSAYSSASRPAKPYRRSGHAGSSTGTASSTSSAAGKESASDQNGNYLGGSNATGSDQAGSSELSPPTNSSR